MLPFQSLRSPSIFTWCAFLSRSRMSAAQACVICGAVSPTAQTLSLRSDDLHSSVCDQCRNDNVRAFEVLGIDGEPTGTERRQPQAPRPYPGFGDEATNEAKEYQWTSSVQSVTDTMGVGMARVTDFLVWSLRGTFS